MPKTKTRIERKKQGSVAVANRDTGNSKKHKRPADARFRIPTSANLDSVYDNSVSNIPQEVKGSDDYRFDANGKEKPT